MEHLDAAGLAARVSPAQAVEALAAAVRGPAHPGVARSRLGVAAGELLLMPAQDDRWVGVKVVSVAGGNRERGLPTVQGTYVLLDAVTLSPVLVLDGTALTTLRTAALSALSASLLAVPEASELVVFGSGPQAWGHVRAMHAVRPLRRVRVVARDPARRDALLLRARGLGLVAEPGTPESVADADLVCTCTDAREPVFDGRLLPEHVHVTAVGAHEPTTREVDTATVTGSYVVVEDRETALRELGTVLLPLAEGALDPGVLHDLRDLLATPPDPCARSLFVAVGAGWEDLAVAGAAMPPSDIPHLVTG